MWSIFQDTFSKIKLTNCLRVIRNAWHFYYALRLSFKVVCGGFGIAFKEEVVSVNTTMGIQEFGFHRVFT